MKKIEKLYSAYKQTSGVSTDSRKIIKGCLFFALKGPNFDGNKFAQSALDKGAKYVVVDDEGYIKKNDKVFLVKDTLMALQSLAAYHRKKLNPTIIGITGSNGKTTTKELIREVLSKKYNTHSTKGNYNNHIGVPLTLLQLTKEHEIGIIEMGANHLKEIERLCSISLPNWGYITNFGKAHIEGFGNEEGVIKGKSELYNYLKNYNGKILVNADDKKQLSLSKNSNRFLFGTDLKANFKIKYLNTETQELQINYNNVIFKSPLHGKYNLANIAAAISFGLLFDVPLKLIQKSILDYQSDNNRSQKLMINKTQIILDAYNANPTSMEAALNAFAGCKFFKKLVVLGDMFELGSQSNEEHDGILRLCIKLKIDKICTIGHNFKKASVENDSIYKFENLESFIQKFDDNSSIFNGVLIKGSRAMQLENLIPFFKKLWVI